MDLTAPPPPAASGGGLVRRLTRTLTRWMVVPPQPAPVRWDIRAAEPIQITQLSKVALGPHDVLVIFTEHTISNATAERLRDYLGTIFPMHQTMVLGDGLRVGVIERDQAEHMAARLGATGQGAA